ncbi:D-alanyl-lipoteichoic acid biosynthesis protein DltD [Oenococcus oeni]
MTGAQRNISYVQSTEYSDFQLVLNEFAKLKVNVMFVIPPVNRKWAT